MTAAEAKVEWLDHQKDCDPCRTYRNGTSGVDAEGHAIPGCSLGDALWQFWVKMMDKEAKNRN